MTNCKRTRGILNIKKELFWAQEIFLGCFVIQKKKKNTGSERKTGVTAVEENPALVREATFSHTVHFSGLTFAFLLASTVFHQSPF